MKNKNELSSELLYSGMDLEVSLVKKVVNLGEENKGSMLGICLMFASNILSSITGALVKETYTYGVTPYEYMYVRGVMIVLCNLIYAIPAQVNPLNISRDVLPPLILRLIAGCFTLIFVLYSLKYLDYSVHTVIMNMSPICVSILGYFFLSEKLSKYDITGIICGFAGISFIVTNNTETEASTREFVLWPYLPGIGAAVGISLIYFCIKKIKEVSNGEISVIVISFYVGLVNSQTGNIKRLYIFEESWTASWRIGGLLGLGCLCSWLSQICLMQALQIEKAGRAAAIKYSQVLFAYLFEIFYFHQKIYFKDVVGAILIAGSNFTITLLKAFKVIT